MAHDTTHELAIADQPDLGQAVLIQLKAEADKLGHVIEAELHGPGTLPASRFAICLSGRYGKVFLQPIKHRDLAVDLGEAPSPLAAAAHLDAFEPLISIMESVFAAELRPCRLEERPGDVPSLWVRLKTDTDDLECLITPPADLTPEIVVSSGLVGIVPDSLRDHSIEVRLMAEIGGLPDLANTKIDPGDILLLPALGSTAFAVDATSAEGPRIKGVRLGVVRDSLSAGSATGHLTIGPGRVRLGVFQSLSSGETRTVDLALDGLPACLVGDGNAPILAGTLVQIGDAIGLRCDAVNEGQE
ncbi:MAG: hypothetical protein AAGJ50_07375 [Pseudomonadota bacterium]